MALLLCVLMRSSGDDSANVAPLRQRPVRASVRIGPFSSQSLAAVGHGSRRAGIGPQSFRRLSTVTWNLSRQGTTPLSRCLWGTGGGRHSGHRLAVIGGQMSRAFILLLRLRN
jgi:hypothetical protein